MRTGLIMEGGAMRGMFTAGVIDVMMEHDIHYDGAIGVSAGASFGCNYQSWQIGRVIRYNERFAKDPRFGSMRSLLLTGDYYGAEFCYHRLPTELDYFDVETFESNPMEFYCVCTDVDTGKAVYHKCKDGKYEDLEWIRASASMPIFSEPVEIGGRRLLDGGISDSIPLKYFQYKGFDRNVVILTQPKGYVKKKSKAAPLIPIALRKYPMVAKRLANRAEAYNRQVAYVEEQAALGNTLVIYPPCELEVGKTEHDPNKLRLVYEIGREEGERMLDEVVEFLKDNA